MKTLQEVLKKSLNAIKATPEQRIETIFDHGQIVRLCEPTSARVLTCPNCGHNEGFYIPYDKTWSCLRPECIALNAGKSNKPVSYAPPKLTLAQCGVPEEFQNASLEGMNGFHSANIAAEIRDYCKRFQGFLLLSGLTGRGKTYASCACMAEYLKRGSTARFVNALDLYLEWLNATQNQGNFLNILEKYGNPGLLVLDDLGAKDPTVGYADFLYTLVHKRMSTSSLATIISTNLKGNEVDDKFGSSFLSRIIRGKVLKFEGKNHRNYTF